MYCNLTKCTNSNGHFFEIPMSCMTCITYEQHMQWNSQRLDWCPLPSIFHCQQNEMYCTVFQTTLQKISTFSPWRIFWQKQIWIFALPCQAQKELACSSMIQVPQSGCCQWMPKVSDLGQHQCKVSVIPLTFNCVLETGGTYSIHLSFVFWKGDWLCTMGIKVVRVWVWFFEAVRSADVV